MLAMKRRLEKHHANGTEVIHFWEVDLPCDGHLYWREGVTGQQPIETNRQYDSLQDACEQLNVLFAEKLADGYIDAPPEWHKGIPAPKAPFVERVTYHEEDPSQPEHRYFENADRPGEEAGPEWRYHDNGVPSNINFQQDTKAEGVRLAYRPSGSIHAIMEMVDDQHHGFYYIFGESGLIEILLQFVRDEKVWSCDFYDNGKIDCLCGPKENGHLHGCWVFRDKDGRTTAEKWFEQGVCVHMHEYEDGQLTYIKDAEDIDDLSKGYTKQLDLTGEHPVLSIFYQDNIVRQQIHNHDGLLLKDVLLMYNEDGEEIDRWYHFYGDDGTLNRLVREQQGTYAEIIRYHPDGSVKQLVSERGEKIVKEINIFHPSGRFDQRQVFLKEDRREIYDFTEEGRLTNIVQSDIHGIWDGANVLYDEQFHVKTWEQWREGVHLTTHSDITMPPTPTPNTRPVLNIFQPVPIPSYTTTPTDAAPIQRTAKDPKARH